MKYKFKARIMPYRDKFQLVLEYWGENVLLCDMTIAHPETEEMARRMTASMISAVEHGGIEIYTAPRNPHDLFIPQSAFITKPKKEPRK